MIHSTWKMMKGVMLVTVLTVSWTVPGRTQNAAASDVVVAEGKQVSFEYTLTLGDGSEGGSNVGQEPLVYMHGKGQIVPGLEKELVGLKAGDTKQVKVTPKDGYGEVDPKRSQQVPIDKIPEQARKVGAQLRGAGPEGQSMFATVTAVDDKVLEECALDVQPAPQAFAMATSHQADRQTGPDDVVDTPFEDS